MFMHLRARSGALFLTALLAGGLAACGTDDGSGVRVIDEGEGSPSGSGAASGSASGSASGVAEEHSEGHSEEASASTAETASEH